MARKKTKNSSGTGILIIFALAFGAFSSLPKNAWIAIGVVACIGGVMWLLATRTKRQLEQLQKSASATTLLRESRSQNVTFSLQEVSSNNMSEETSDFYTVQLGSTPSASFKIPDASKQKSDTRWVPADESVSVAGFLLPGGMLYVGSALGRYDSQEPSLINPKLRIAKSYVDIEERLMSYWPSFHSISPEARRGYLQWLEGGRRDPLADTGYVFLFFYGLERRALVDAVSDPQVKVEIPQIVKEVQRLLSIYGENRSFRVTRKAFWTT